MEERESEEEELCYQCYLDDRKPQERLSVQVVQHLRRKIFKILLLCMANHLHMGRLVICFSLLPLVSISDIYSIIMA